MPPPRLRYQPTVRHFHNQPELQNGGFGLMMRWILFVWLASCGPLGNTVKQDGNLYLRSHLKKEALALIEGLPLTDTSYQEALRLLKERYDNPCVLITSYVNTILDYPAMQKGSAASIHEFVSSMKQQIGALKNMEQPVESWDMLLLPILLRKIDQYSARAYHMDREKAKLPTIADFMDFLERRAASFEESQRLEMKQPVKKTAKPVNLMAVNKNEVKTESPTCRYCDLSGHKLFTCPKFKMLETKERISFIKEKGFCQICLNPHKNKCKFRFKCSECNSKEHNSLLHLNDVSVNASYVPSQSQGVVLLPTVKVKVAKPDGSFVIARGLLDSGSQTSFITKELKNELNIQSFTKKLNVKTLGQQNNPVSEAVVVNITSVVNDSFNQSVVCSVVDKITSPLPQFKLNMSEFLPNVIMADDQYNVPGEISLLLAADIFFNVLIPENIRLKDGLILQNTKFGFIIAGGMSNLHSHVTVTETASNFISSVDKDQNLDQSLGPIMEKFFEVETLGSEGSKVTEEEELCEKDFKEKVQLKDGSCAFPARWHGRWFQSGVIQPILIEGDRLSNKGKCISNEGDKFLIVDEKGCYRCVVMHEKHKNVLQYKETFCHRRDALPHLCSLITGDALLYSMFRENADAVDCPLKGPFSFTYNRGHGDCKSPVSSIETCTEDSRLLLNYQACPDVHGSESAVEELECLATWKEGSLRFLVGKLHHNHATSNEDRYRCFVYEKTNGIGSGSGMKEGPTSPAGVEYRVAQSGDATCNGLFSATEGSRTMALRRVSVRFNCQFPPWMTFSHTWHTLDFSSNYTFYQRNATLRITNQTGADIKVYCVNVKASSPSGNSVALVAHWQHHCASRYVCVVLYRRDTFIAELQRGSPTTRPDDACSSHHFNAVTAPYVTLVASNPESKECPYLGKYTIQNRHRRSIRSPPKSETDTLEDTRSKREKAMFEHNRRVNGTRLFNFSVRNMSDAPMLRSRRQLEGNEVGCAVSSYNRLEVGCNSAKNMEFYSTCENKEIITAYTCHGGWYEGGASFVVTTPITRDSTAARRYCFVSRESPSGALELTRSASNCERATTEPEPLVFDATSTGECQDQTNSHTLLRIPSSPIVYLSIAIFPYIIPR